jgi:DNA (cytosine-5)-methyltransferase 1
MLADRLNGGAPSVAIEWDAYCCRVLADRADEGWFPGLRVICADVRSVDFASLGHFDAIHAGFPCQDISASGTGDGIDGERSGLVREVFRAIDDIRPSWVFMENSPRIRTRGRSRVLAAFMERGYLIRDGLLSAQEAGAPHIRDRWWALAHLPNPACFRLQGSRLPDEPRAGNRPADWIPSDDSNAYGDGLEVPLCNGGGGLDEADRKEIEAVARYTQAPHWNPPVTCHRGLVDGRSHRVDRIKAAGNGQVPICAALAWRLLGGPVT